jgi:hypothetical protein
MRATVTWPIGLNGAGFIEFYSRGIVINIASSLLIFSRVKINNYP